MRITASGGPVGWHGDVDCAHGIDATANPIGHESRMPTAFLEVGGTADFQDRSH